MAERKELDPFEGAFRWAISRFRRIAAGWFVGDVVFGAIVWLLARWAGGTVSTAASFGYFVGGCVGFALVLLAISLLLTLREQRNALRLTIGAKDAEIATLTTNLTDEDVAKEHFEALKSILEHAKTYVVRGQDIAFKTPYDVLGIQGHFPEIGPVLSEWDEIARTTAHMESALEDQYKAEVASQGFNTPDFNYEAFDYLLGNIKLLAKAQKLDEDQRIEWRDFDPDAPDLYLWKGTFVAKVNDTQMGQIYGNMKIRIQQFFNLAKTWPETKIYGDKDWLTTYNDKQKELMGLLDSRIIRFGYKRRNGCPQCPQ
jgi:hypothetical protein